MSDISKCNGMNCPVKDRCFRFLAPSHPYRQWYVGISSTEAATGEDCHMFWNVRGNLETLKENHRD